MTPQREVIISRRTYVVVSTAMILLFAVAAIAFYRFIPPFENSDELGHVGYVTHVARHRELPRVTVPPNGVFDQEGMQTPLYYISAAPFLGDAPDPARPPRNHAFRFAPGTPGSVPHRMFLPITNNSPPGLQAMAAACNKVRIASICWGMLAAIAASAFLWQLPKGNTPQAIVALAIFLFNPRWIESAASAGNDVAATAAATATLLFLIHLLRKKETTLLSSVLLGICCCAATLTKLNNAGLVLLAIVVVAEKGKPRWVALASLIVAFLLPLVPWMIRNQLLYGDLLTTNPDLHRYFVSIRGTPLSVIRFFAEEFEGFRWSYFAVFGQFGVLADPPVYPVLDAFLLICGVGGIVGLGADLRSSHGIVEKSIVLLPFLWIVTIFAEFIFHNRIFLASQGRLIYPASACIAYILARGCMLLTPAKAQVTVAIVVSTLFLLFAFYVAFSVLPRAYSF